jgi:hypothetical protein
MRPATRILGRTGPISVLAATPSAVIQPISAGLTRPDFEDATSASPVPVTPPADLDTALAELAQAIDQQLEVLDALVSATQDQLKALISLKGVGLESAAPGQTPLDEVHGAIAKLSTRLGLSGDRVRNAARVLHHILGGADDTEPTLSELVAKVPAERRELAAERVSALRSLAQALAELQRVSLVHANRGLQAIAAWRTVLGVPETESGATYNRAGRSKARSPNHATSLELEL